MDETVKRLLHLVGAGIQLVQKQAIGFLARDRLGWAKAADSVLNLRHPQQVLWGELASQERDARQPQGSRELLHDGRLPDSRWSPDEHRTNQRDVQQEVSQP